jgi:hypothetical protein
MKRRALPRRSIAARTLPAWLAVVVCLLAAALAIVVPEAAAEPTPEPTPEAAPAATNDAALEGLAPMPGDAEVPLKWMPPGTAVSPLPSDEIFPPQTIPLRFSHKKHVKELKQGCKACHAAAYTSGASSDRLLPKPAASCDGCHDVDHGSLEDVKAGRDANGQCGYCHLGAKAGEGGKVAPLVIPRPNLHFAHDKHLARNIGCAQCHGQVGELELATREQLPRMAGCFTCHDKTGAAQGDAKSECTTCHVAQPDGRIQVAFATGQLVPPRWLRSAAHTADWIERHKSVAADDSAFCGTCHTAKECTDCHDGRVRPRSVHPNDFLSMHPQAAKQDNPRCVSCHQQQTFCADCHRRTGVARDAPSGNRASGRRFHPPPERWTTGPRSATHHAWEAQRNLNACVSCHTERDCATCHATRGLGGGQGVSPHPPGFRDRCATALQRNPRPCLVCHASSDALTRSCR